MRQAARATALAAGLALGLLLQPAPRAASTTWLHSRVTFYLDRGVTYSGHWTGPGTAACSWNLPLGTVVRFWDGREVTCLDRGRLGSDGWIDVWMPSYHAGLWEIEAVYGLWSDVEIVRLGW